MPHILNKTILSEGTEKSIVHFYIESDGSADLVNEPLWDPATDFMMRQVKELSADGQYTRIPRISILRVWNRMNGPVCTLTWEGSPGWPGYVITPGDDSLADYSMFGGIKDMTVPTVNIGQFGAQTVVGGNTASEASTASTPASSTGQNATLDPKSAPVPAGADIVPSQYGAITTGNVQSYPPQMGTGRLLVTTQGMSIPSLAGSVANGMFIIEFKRYLG